MMIATMIVRRFLEDCRWSLGIQHSATNACVEPHFMPCTHTCPVQVKLLFEQWWVGVARKSKRVREEGLDPKWATKVKYLHHFSQVP